MQTWLSFQAWFEFAYIDVVSMLGFRALQRTVKRVERRSRAAGSTVPQVLDAVRTAGLLYIKPARCLQRSAVVTRILRRQGVEAQMVIGCQTAPVKGHAWVEVDGKVVCEYMHGIEHYQVLDRW